MASLQQVRSANLKPSWWPRPTDPRTAQCPVGAGVASMFWACGCYPAMRRRQAARVTRLSVHTQAAAVAPATKSIVTRLGGSWLPSVVKACTLIHQLRGDESGRARVQAPLVPAACHRKWPQAAVAVTRLSLVNAFGCCRGGAVGVPGNRTTSVRGVGQGC